MEDLKVILEDDELHLIQLLLKDVKLAVKVENNIGPEFTTNVGSPQGDCASPIFFIFYLAKALEEQRKHTIEDHSYSKQPVSRNLNPKELEDHTYSTMTDNSITIDQQYADDTGWISNSSLVIKDIEEKVPSKLKERKLQVNEEKTEKYNIRRGGDSNWKKCKYLGSLLDSQEDIQRRKCLANSAFNKIKDVISSKKIGIKTKLRIFKALVESIFLYNCEIWTLTTEAEKKIDVLQRNYLRKIIKITWEDKISNKELYEKVKEDPWSEKIKRRRLTWLGHLCRLPEETPARKALQEAMRKTRRPQGRPTTTWIANIEKELRQMGINGIKEAKELCQDRKLWACVISSIKSQKTRMH